MVAVGQLVPEAVAVADELASGISVEVFDPRTVHPFDWAGLAASVGRTGQLVVIREHRRGGTHAHRTTPPRHPPRRPGTALRPGTRPRGPAASGLTRGGGAGGVLGGGGTYG
ncbi:transketolase C-terminal domain-containing protein [Streptomyces sp. NPDC005901]|uniref:transketolase C-terminal domain-containing protein n=1 Tax=Streptomyces sp. NPDC005901 TaxID=3157171 RepID=UPI0033E9E1FB